jgi:hypothetical protein
MHVRIYGHSDDCVIVDGIIMEEVSPPAMLRVGSKDGPGIIIRADFAPDWLDGSWVFSTTLTGDDVPLPADWTVSVRHEHEYSVAVHVEAPVGTPVALLDEGGAVRASYPSIRDAALAKLSAEERSALGLG